jgi:two-component system, LytTR family, sensor kinase
LHGFWLAYWFILDIAVTIVCCRNKTECFGVLVFWENQNTKTLKLKLHPTFVRKEEIARLIYTDLAQARELLSAFESTMTPKSDFRDQLFFHKNSAFLDNQSFQFDAAIQHLNAALEIETSLVDKISQTDTLIDIAAVYINQRQWEKAESHLEDAKKNLQNVSENPILLAFLLIREGFIQLHFKQFKKALNKFLEAERLLLTSNETSTLKEEYYKTLLHSSLGETYTGINDKEKSIAAYLRTLEICENFEIKPRLGWHYLNGGRARMALNEYEEAYEYLEKSIRYADEKDLTLRANALANFGILAFMNGEETQALQLLDQASALFLNPQTPSDFVNLSKIEIWKAELSLEKGELDLTEKHYANALIFGEKGDDLQHLLDVYTANAGFMAEINRFEAAYNYQKHAASLAAKLNIITHDRELRELENRHELEKRRQESNLAKLRLTGLQLRALRAQMNPHFLFNALNAVQGFITSGKNEDAEMYLARFAKFMRRTLDYSDTEKVTLASEMEFLEYYLDIYKNLRFNGNLKYNIKINEEIDWDDVSIPSMIIQPFIENAIEHGLSPKDGGKITLNFKFSEDEESLLCTIEDDGVGLNVSKAKRQLERGQYHAHRSRGMEITKERLTLLQEQKGLSTDKLIKIMDLDEKTKGIRKGTRVEVVIPLL